MRPAAPPRYKLALLSWLGAYPLITVILGFLGPATSGWQLLLRTLLVSGLMVVGMSWVTQPALAYLFQGWLAARVQTRGPDQAPNA